MTLKLVTDFRTPSQRVNAGADAVIHDLVHGTGDEQPTVPQLGSGTYRVEDEPAAEHIANALALLTTANYFSGGPTTVSLTRDEYEAIRARLEKAVRLLSVARIDR